MREINIDDSDKKGLIQAIEVAVRDDIRDFKMEKPLETYNCIHHLKWDFMNTNLARKVDKEKYEPIHLDRGIFTPQLLYDNVTTNLYGFMRRQTFAKCKKDRNKRKVPHYIDAMVTLNKDIYVEKDQVELYETDKIFDSNQIEEILQKAFGGKYLINQFVLCLFDESRGEIVSFEAHILDKNLNTFVREDWSEFITPNFDIDFNEYPDPTPDDDMEIGIKGNKEDLDVKRKEEEKEETSE